MPRKTLQLNILVNQINLGRCKDAASQLRMRNISKEIDVTLLQEPACYRGKVIGFGPTNRVIQQDGLENPMAAIIISNPNLDVIKVDHLTNPHCAVAVIRDTKNNYVMASIYFQYRHGVEPYLEMITKIIQSFPDDKIIIGADVNAQSTAWHSHKPNKKGATVLAYLNAKQLLVQNTVQKLMTYKGKRTYNVNYTLARQAANRATLDRGLVQESNLDVTITNIRANNSIEGWRVVEGPVKSDHREISFTIEGAVLKQSLKIPGYKTRSINWDNFDEAVDTHPPLSTDNNHDVESSLNEITEAVTSICDLALKRKKIRPDAVAWWTEDINRIKRETNRKRREYQALLKIVNTNNKPDPQLIKLKNELKLAYNNFSKAIHDAKTKSWRKFHDDVGNKDPWGPVYKLYKGKVTRTPVLSTLRETNNSADLIDTYTALSDSMFPFDDPATDTNNNTELRNSATLNPDTPCTPPITEEEVFYALARMKSGKAPGIDNLDADILRHSWPLIGEKFSQTIEAARVQKVFPNLWKTGKLVILPKPDKPLDSVKAYRPITLLPVLGKVFEKVIATRLSDHLENNGLLSEAQYGFRKHRGTEDALLKVQEVVNSTREKYLVGFFLDISGAFDNAWPPKILERLRELNCPRDIYEIIRSYLGGRKVVIESNQIQILKAILKGCPQGSVLGPLLWIILFDELLQMLGVIGYKIIAYADDLLVMIPANSIADLKTRLQNVCNLVHDWSITAKLSLSSEKTKILVFKGKYESVKAKLTVYLDITNIVKPVSYGRGKGCTPSNKIQVVKEYKHLGVKLDHGDSFAPQAAYAGSRAATLFKLMRPSCRRDWGIKHKNLMTIYKGVFVPTVTYGSAVWYHKAGNARNKRELRKHQRAALLTCTRAYKTAPTLALIAIAGVLPVDQEIRLAAKMSQARVRLRADDDKTEEQVYRELAELKKKLKEQCWNDWQREWERTEEAGYTRDFIPDVRAWAKRRHDPCHYVVQALTGHGNFEFYLARFNLGSNTNGFCECRKLQTPAHVFNACPKYARDREFFLQSINWTTPEFAINKLDLLEKENYSRFATYVRKILTEKQEKDKDRKKQERIGR